MDTYNMPDIVLGLGDTWWINKQGLSLSEIDVLVGVMKNKQSCRKLTEE
jgi:hypothetical protein